MCLVCNKDGKIKETYKEMENENDDTYEYDGYAYVEFDENDKYIDCKMNLSITDDEAISGYVAAELCDMVLGGIRKDIAYLKVRDDKNCIIISTRKNKFKNDEDYNTFEFDNINSYERFGVYAEAVMTAIQRMINYK